MFTLQLLGSASLDGPDGPVGGRASLRRRVALLALLAVEHPRPLSRDRLIAYLWPENGADDARHLLRDSLYILRSALGDDSVLSAGDDLRLNPDRVTCDLWEFESALVRDDPRRAVEVYGGPLLSGFHLSGADEFDRWAEAERLRLARRYVQALERLAERHTRSGNALGATEWWTRLAREDPYNSRIALRLMQALESAGDRAGALRHASAHSELLHTDLDAAPAPEVMALAERLRREPLPLPLELRVTPELPRALGAALDGDERERRTAMSIATPHAGGARRDAGSEARRRWIVAAAALVLVAAVGAVLVRPRPTAPSALDSNLIAVAPFDVVAPALRPWSEGLVDVLSRSLDGAGPLRTVAPTVALKRWTGRADPASATELARRTGAGLVVFGALDHSGGTDSVRIRAALLEVGRAEPPLEVEVRGDTLRMDRLVDSLAVALLREVGRTRPVRAVRQSPLGANSLPALKAFLQGEQFYRRGLWDSALPQYDRAISLDSTFALAYRRMGLVLNWFSAAAATYKPFDEYVRRAATLNHGLAPRDSLLVLADTLYVAVMYDMGWDPSPEPHQLANLQRLFATLAEAQRRYPGDPEVWYALGEARYHLDDPFEAPGVEILNAFDRAIALDSGFAPAYIHTPGLALAIDLGDPDRARRYLAAYLRLNPADDNTAPLRLAARMLDPQLAHLPETGRLIDTAPAGVLWRAAEDLNQWPDSAETAVRLLRSLVVGRHSFAGIDPRLHDSAVLRRQLAYVLMSRGHLREAYRTYQATRPDQWESPYDPYVRLALLGAVPADTAAAVFRRPLEQGLPKGPVALVRVLAWWYAQRDTVSLSRFATRAGSIARSDSTGTMVNALKHYPGAAAWAYVTLARGDSVAALRAFAALPDSFCAYWESGCRSQKLIEARLLAAVGEDRRATEVLDRWAGLDPLAILEQARLAERIGNREKAIKSYQFVADVWRHADSELQPYVVESRKGIKRLTGEPREKQ
jgi:eukaryotic-like serine/threonine-protein kinase